MQLSLLRLEGIRNLKSTQLDFHSDTNIILGPNGSGKTSLLEAIYLLSLGRSFKSKELQSVISYDQNHLTCFGKVSGAEHTFVLGIEKKRNIPLLCQLKGKTGLPITEFIGHLALQSITPDSFMLLNAGPEQRRKFLDLGVFHVEPNYINTSMRYKKLLKQRNALLKQSNCSSQLKHWDESFVRAAEALNQKRTEYFEGFMPVFSSILDEFLPTPHIQSKLSKGWRSEMSFADALCHSKGQDLRFKTTNVGPHRGDIKLTTSGYAVQQVLSRGQQKLLVCALILAQSVYLFQQKGIRCVYLLDDLASELDSANLNKVLCWLRERQHQVFITSVDKGGWAKLYENTPSKVFHVEQGLIKEISSTNCKVRASEEEGSLIV